MKTVNYTQGSPEWLAWREDGIGASEVPAVLGLSPHVTRARLLDQKVRLTQSAPNPAMLRGQALEDTARRLYEDVTGSAISPACCEHPRYPWLRASLDGVTFDRSHLVEIKCPNMADHLAAVAGEVPKHYYAQVQAQMLVTGIDRADYVSYHPEADEPMAIVSVRADKAMQERIVAECTAFWSEVCAARDGASNVRPLLTPTTVPVAVESPEARAMAEQAIGAQEQAAEITVHDTESFHVAAAFVTTINGRRKELERVRKSLLEPVREVERRIDALFQPAIKALEGAERTLKDRMGAYRAEQERIREAELRAAREAAEAQARAEREAARRAAEEARAALAIATEPEEAAVAERVLAQAEQAAKVAEIVRPMVAQPVTELPKVAGLSSRTTWHAEVTDLRALLRAALERDDLLALVSVDTKALNAMARTQKERFAVPGCKAVPTQSMAVRGVA